MFLDWLKCHKFALSNRTKEVCELWKNGIHSTIKISEITKISRGVVINYLNQGALIGWCDYNAKEETRKSAIKSNKLKGKQVIMLTLDDEFINIFKSNMEIQKNSEEMFGIKLRHEGVSTVARGDTKSYKGYHFKYVRDLTPEEYIKYNIEEKLEIIA